MMTLTEFLLARIASDEAVARVLLRDLEVQIETEGFAADERGPFTPARMLAAQLWAHYDGQTRWRNFARGHHIATLADPARVLAECEAKRRIVEDFEVYAADARTERTEFAAGRRHAALLAVTQIATVYADHPDFDPAWCV